MLVFPEGRKGTEKLYKDRYRLRRFGRGGFVEAAMRAEAKLVPDLRRRAPRRRMPVFAPARLHEEADRAPLLPHHPDLPLARPARDARLPAGEVQDPVPGADRHRRSSAAREAAQDKALVQTVAQEIRARIQENLHDMLATRKSVWLG